VIDVTQADGSPRFFSCSLLISRLVNGSVTLASSAAERGVALKRYSRTNKWVSTGNLGAWSGRADGGGST
jgi:hypothetical protein